jgi:hypothetical protein
MATSKQTKAARQNITKARDAAKSKRTLAHMPKRTRTALGKQGAAVAQRKRSAAKTGGESIAGAAHQSIEPSRATRATDSPSPMVP